MQGALKRAKQVFAREGAVGLWRRLKLYAAGFFPRLGKRAWLKRYTPTAAELEEMRRQAQGLAYRPVIAVVLPVYNPDLKFLRAALDSVLSQVYPFWELCIADDASTQPCVRALLREYQEKDSRVKVVYREKSGHISQASNSALDMAAGEFVALLDHDDMLSPHALFEVALALNRDRSLDMLYSNEDKINKKGVRMAPAFKAAWSPEYFLSFMYIGHLSVFRRSLIERAGRFRAGFEGSQDYDLALRVSELTDNVKHLPAILYHWRKHRGSVAANIRAKPYAFEAAKRALREAMLRRGFKNPKVEDTWSCGIYKTSIGLTAPPKVVVLVHFPAEDGMDRALSALCAGTAHQPVEYLSGVIGNPAAEAKPRKGSFCSLSEFVQWARRGVRADYILIMDGRLRPRRTDWLEHMVQYAVRDKIGVVGAKVSAPDFRCLHAGYTILGTRAAHNGFGFLEFNRGYAARLIAAHNVSAVSAMCLLTDAALLESSRVCDQGYLSQAAFEIALCFEAQAQGARVVWTPHAELVAEGWLPQKTVDLSALPKDCEILQRKYALSTFVDPYYPPGLDKFTMDFRLEL